MNRFVLRFDKFHRGAGLTAILDHCARRKVPPNADPARGHLNRIVGDSNPRNYIVAGKKLVAAVETVISASPEWFQGVDSSTWRSYVEDSARFLERHFGGRAMLVAEHYDERAPHVHFMHCPHVIGTSGKAMIGGPKSRLEQYQTSFQEEVARTYGLHRIHGSLGSHTKLKEFYAGLDEEFKGEGWRVQSKRKLDELQLQAQFGRMQAREFFLRYLAGDPVLLQILREELAEVPVLNPEIAQVGEQASCIP